MNAPPSSSPRRRGPGQLGTGMCSGGLVIPAEAGTQSFRFLNALDSRLRGNDELQ
jgi:hypothetical protein